MKCTCIFPDIVATDMSYVNFVLIDVNMFPMSGTLIIFQTTTVAMPVPELKHKKSKQPRCKGKYRTANYSK